MDTNILQQGFDLMLYGMGTVFVFLTVLVFATRAMSAVVSRWQPASVDLPKQPAQVAGTVEDQQLLAVISAAIHAHRQNHQK